MNDIFKIFFILELALLFISALFIGLGDTLIWILLTCVAGIFFLRWALRRGSSPMLLGGILLIFPGYITDVVGVLLICNFPLLNVLYNLGVISSLQRMGGGMGMRSTVFTQHFDHTGFDNRPHTGQPKSPAKTPPQGDIIDGDFTRKDD